MTKVLLGCRPAGQLFSKRLNHNLAHFKYAKSKPRHKPIITSQIQSISTDRPEQTVQT